MEQWYRLASGGGSDNIDAEEEALLQISLMMDRVGIWGGDVLVYSHNTSGIFLQLTIHFSRSFQ